MSETVTPDPALVLARAQEAAAAAQERATNAELRRLTAERRTYRDQILGATPGGCNLIYEQARIEALASGLAFVNPALKGVGPALIVFQMAEMLRCAPVALAQHAYVVEGRLAWSTEGWMAMAYWSGRVTAHRWDEHWGATPGDQWATCTITLADGQEVSHTVSMADRQRARWRGQQWDREPDLMLRWRSIRRAIQRGCPGLALGLSVEDRQDMSDPPGTTVATYVHPATPVSEATEGEYAEPADPLAGLTGDPKPAPELEDRATVEAIEQMAMTPGAPEPAPVRAEPKTETQLPAWAGGMP